MIKEQDIFKRTEDNKEFTYIKIGSSELDIPTSMLQGEKSTIILWKESGTKYLNWEGFRAIDGNNCLCLGEVPDIKPLSSLAGSLKADSIKYLKMLCKAYQALGDEIYLTGGIAPMSTIYFTSDGILFIPYQVFSIIDTIVDDKFRFEDKEVWWSSDTIFEDFLFPNYLTQLLYFSLTGMAPYTPIEVRDDGFHPIPLSLDSDNEAAALCDEILNYSRKNTMYKNPLNWILNRLENISPLTEGFEVEDSPKLEKFKEKQTKRAKFSVFKRKKGTKTLIIAVISIIVVFGLGSWIAKFFEPPLTRDETPEQIIESYYQAQNDLDIENLETSLHRRVKSPFSTEITSLFVSSKMRMAYEQKETIVNPETWIAEGRPELESDINIYGNSDLKITRLDDDTWHAESILYSPSDYLGTEEVISEIVDESIVITQKPLYKYKYIEDYDFIKVNDWYEISDIRTVSVTLIEKEELDVLPPSSNSVQNQITAD